MMSARALPPELCMLVETHLSNRDIKSLRLVCKDFCTKFRLRLERVFLSANPLNIHVFRSIAEHETFRHGVHEIIWDDARLRAGASRKEMYRSESMVNSGVSSDSELSDSDIKEEETKDAEGIPKWYEVLCRKSAFTEQRPRNHKSDYKSERPEYEARMQQAMKQVPTVESWKHYQQLLRQQEEVISTGADADALRYGLSRFTALRRLAITPAAHGSLFAPVYETPMIRAFPEGFMYPVSCAWPGLDDSLGYETMMPWDDDEREKWRGVCIVLRELAQQEHSVTEFLIHSHGMYTGLSCRVFDQPCQEYDDFKALLSRPGFRHLELSLNTDLWHYPADGKWHFLGLLYEALSTATDLEHLDFCFQVGNNVRYDPDLLPPLDTILPFDQWPKLRHFGLGNGVIADDDLISTLQRLPRSLRSVELSALEFSGGVDDWLGLFYRFRDDLDWHTRNPDQRPRVAVYIGPLATLDPVFFLGKEIERFMYENGPDPFTAFYDSSDYPTDSGIVRSPFSSDSDSEATT